MIPRTLVTDSCFPQLRRSGVAKTIVDESASPDQIFQLGLGFWGSKTLLSAVELGLFSELAHGPLSAEALRGKLRLHARSARDFFDALVALGMLNREGDRYANTPATDLFLVRSKPSYVGGLLEMANARLYPFWGSLTEALQTGEPQNEAKHGGDLFESLYADPERLAGFLRAMSGISMGSARAIARQFPWGNYKHFADIGTAQGGLAVQVALANSHLSAVGFDLPPIRQHFEAHVAAHNLTKRVVFQEGNFFADPLPSAEVLVMGHILHDWGLEKKHLLISKAYEALPKGGALIVYETIIDDERRQNAFGLLMSLNMLIETREGFDYTGSDCAGWMSDAGFSNTRVEPLVGPESMVVGFK
jgi:precorrin-6B methylase 2